MKYLISIILFSIFSISSFAQTRGVSYDNVTRNVIQTDLDFTAASMNATVLQRGGVDVVDVGRTLTAGAGLAGGGSLAANRTFTLDMSTFVDNVTLWNGANATRTLTFNLSAGDPVLSLGNGVFNISSGTLQQGGTAVALQGGALGAATVTAPAAGNDSTRVPSTAWVQDELENLRVITVPFTFIGDGAAISVGSKGYYKVKGFSGTLVGVTVHSPASASIVFDIWKDVAANYPPTVADTMIGGGGTKPNLTSDNLYEDTTFTGWSTTTITDGDWIFVNCDSGDSEYCQLYLHIRR